MYLDNKSFVQVYQEVLEVWPILPQYFTACFIGPTNVLLEYKLCIMTINVSQFIFSQNSSKSFIKITGAILIVQNDAPPLVVVVGFSVVVVFKLEKYQVNNFTNVLRGQLEYGRHGNETSSMTRSSGYYQKERDSLNT